MLSSTHAVFADQITGTLLHIIHFTIGGVDRVNNVLECLRVAIDAVVVIRIQCQKVLDTELVQALQQRVEFGSSGAVARHQNMTSDKKDVATLVSGADILIDSILRFIILQDQPTVQVAGPVTSSQARGSILPGISFYRPVSV